MQHTRRLAAKLGIALATLATFGGVWAGVRESAPTAAGTSAVSTQSAPAARATATTRLATASGKSSSAVVTHARTRGS